MDPPAVIERFLGAVTQYVSQPACVKPYYFSRMIDRLARLLDICLSTLRLRRGRPCPFVIFANI
jgi:hypothetical protein